MSTSWRYAAVHLGYTEISVVATGGLLEGPRESVGSAFASAEGGDLVFGSADAGGEISPLLCIDDPAMAVGTSVWDSADVLLGIVSSALQGAGVSDRLDVLEIAYPSIWGEQRSSSIRAVFAGTASEVVLVETAEAAVASWGERAPSAAMVVEVGPLDTSVLVIDETGDCGGDTGAVLAFGIDDEWRRAVDEYVRSSVDPCPDEVFVVAPSRGRPEPIADRSTHWLTGLDIARSLYRRAGAEIHSVPPVRAATTRSAAWLDDVTSSSTNRRSNRRTVGPAVAAVTAVVIASACAALYFASAGAETIGAAAVQPSSTTEVADAPSSSEAEPPALPTASPEASRPAESVTFVSGRASVRLPAGWTRLDDPARMVLIPPTPPERRIVVTVADLNPGSTQAQVAADLRVAVDARGPDSTIGSLEPTKDFGSRIGIAYLESPADDSTVLWRVFVESDLQVSIGCQFEGDDSAVIDTECGQATQTLEIVPSS